MVKDGRKFEERLEESSVVVEYTTLEEATKAEGSLIEEDCSVAAEAREELQDGGFRTEMPTQTNECEVAVKTITDTIVENSIKDALEDVVTQDCRSKTNLVDTRDSDSLANSIPPEKPFLRNFQGAKI